MRTILPLCLVAVLAASTALAQDPPLPPPKPAGDGAAAEAAPDATDAPKPAPKPDLDGRAGGDASTDDEATGEAVTPEDEEPAAATSPAADTSAEDGPESTDEADTRSPDTEPADTEASDTADEPGSADTEPDPDDEAAEDVPPPSVLQPLYEEAAMRSCERDLAAMGVDFEVLKPIAEEFGCGTPRPLQVTAVGDVAIEPAVTVRCPVAKALAAWMKEVVVPSAKLHLGEEPNGMATGGSYECRQRVGGDEVRFSEHASANAVDVVALSFAERGAVSMMPRPDSADAERPFQAAIRGGACAYFTTVLGPTTNEAHDDHLHLDLAERSGGYRLCE